MNAAVKAGRQLATVPLVFGKMARNSRFCKRNSPGTPLNGNPVEVFRPAANFIAPASACLMQDSFMPE